MRLVYDIETNGLDPDKIWCLVAQDIDKGTIYKFSDYDDSLLDSQAAIGLLQKADVIIGHNIINFDNRMVKRIW